MGLGRVRGILEGSEGTCINHNGGELIYDLAQHLVPRTWNTFCYKFDPNRTFQIVVNGKKLRSDKYPHRMENFELKSPILLGGNSENDAEKHRFFGEITDFNIWSGNLEDNFENRKEETIVGWKSATISFGSFKEHIRMTKETVPDRTQNEKIWVSRNVKDFEAGFLDCEHLGGKPVFSYDIDVLKEWDEKGSCDYFWLPVVFRKGSWWDRHSNVEIYKVLLLLEQSCLKVLFLFCY
jgi:hypothetical protein